MQSLVVEGRCEVSHNVVVIKYPVRALEVRVCQRVVRCTGVMPVLGIGSVEPGPHEEQCALVMPKLRTLRDVCESEHPSAQLRLQWAEQLVRALKAVHAAGVLHRDIKPSNLYVDDRDRAVIGDFGSALLDYDEKNRPNWDGQGITLAFASVNARRRGFPCVDDDWESLCYSLYWCSGVHWLDYRQRPDMTLLAKDVAVQVVLRRTSRTKRKRRGKRRRS
jgi:serine/threonine protein kinase